MFKNSNKKSDKYIENNKKKEYSPLLARRTIISDKEHILVD